MSMPFFVRRGVVSLEDYRAFRTNLPFLRVLPRPLIEQRIRVLRKQVRELKERGREHPLQDTLTGLPGHQNGLKIRNEW